jgi:uncharacterized membrane protein
MLKTSWHDARAGAARVLAGPEGRILFAGALLAVATVLGFSIAWLFAPGATSLLAAMTGLNLLIGIAAGMSFGYANGLGHLEVIGSSFLADTLQVLIVYPLFVLSWQHLLDVGRLAPYLARMRVSAEAQQGWVRRFGIVGLFLFVFVPFWMTGPVVGSIIGFLIGLRPVVNLAVVLIATYAATWFWAILLGGLNHVAATYNRYALFLAILAIILLTLAWRVLARRRA